jgi:DNA-binding ferritin-like protein (Dps family)
MKKNRIEEGRFSANARGLGTVTREMVLKRAREIAEINGRPDRVLDSDFQEAHRELTQEDFDEPPRAAADLVPEDKRWMEVPENEGKKVGEVPAPDEQTFAEKLVEEGVEDAEHDQMTRASREAARRDNEG